MGNVTESGQLFGLFFLVNYCVLTHMVTIFLYKSFHLLLDFPTTNPSAHFSPNAPSN